MDLKYNLAQTWLLRDRSPLPITTLEVIKDSPEFVTLASSEHLERSIFFLNSIFQMHAKGTLCMDIHLGFNLDLLEKTHSISLSERHDPNPSL